MTEDEQIKIEMNKLLDKKHFESLFKRVDVNKELLTDTKNLLIKHKQENK